MRRSLLLLLALAALSLVALSARADETSGSQELHYGDTIDIELDFQSGRSMDVDYEVTVLSGPGVWVYFVDLSGYRDYIDPGRTTFAYYETWSSLDTYDARTGFVVEEHDTYYLIIENSDGSQRTATVRYRVTYDVDSGASRTLLYVLAGIIVVGFVVVFLALAVRARARSASYHPPVLPGTAGTQTGQYLPVPGSQYPPQPPQGPYYQEPSFWERQYDDRHYHHHHYGRNDYGHGSRSRPSNRSSRRTMRKRL